MAEVHINETLDTKAKERVTSEVAVTAHRLGYTVAPRTSNVIQILVAHAVLAELDESEVAQFQSIEGVKKVRP